MTHRRYLLSLLLFGYAFLVVVGFSCLANADQHLDEAFQLDRQSSPFPDLLPIKLRGSFGCFFAAFIFCQLPVGMLIDHVGPRRILAAFTILASVGAILLGALRLAATRTSGTAGIVMIGCLALGLGLSGVFSGAARAVFAWSPAHSRAAYHAIIHSGARLGIVLSILVGPHALKAFGWSATFTLFAVVGLAWALIWWRWYRDSPDDHRAVDDPEFDHIQLSIDEEERAGRMTPTLTELMCSFNSWLLIFQSFASGLAFFTALICLPIYLSDRTITEADYWYAMPFLVGAATLIICGACVRFLQQRNHFATARRLPPMIGFAVSAASLLLCTHFRNAEATWPLVACMTGIIVGAELTFPSSWALANDLARHYSATLGGVMVVALSLGAVAVIIGMPYFSLHVTIPVFAETRNTIDSFFTAAAVICSLAIVSCLVLKLSCAPPGQNQPQPPMINR